MTKKRESDNRSQNDKWGDKNGDTTLVGIPCSKWRLVLFWLYGSYVCLWVWVLNVQRKAVRKLFGCIFFMWFSGGILVDIIAINVCAISKVAFIITFISLFVVYLCFCCYTFFFFSEACSLSNNKFYIFFSKLIVIISTVIFGVKIVLLLGVFIHDNQVIPMEKLYEKENGIPLEAVLRLIVIGFEQLSANDIDEPWTLFFRSVKGLYIGGFFTSVVWNIWSMVRANSSFEKRNT